MEHGISIHEFWVDSYEILTRSKICEWDFFLNVTRFEKENHLNQITSIFGFNMAIFPECKLFKEEICERNAAWDE